PRRPRVHPPRRVQLRERLGRRLALLPRGLRLPAPDRGILPQPSRGSVHPRTAVALADLLVPFRFQPCQRPQQTHVLRREPVREPERPLRLPPESEVEQHTAQQQVRGRIIGAEQQFLLEQRPRPQRPPGTTIPHGQPQEHGAVRVRLHQQLQLRDPRRERIVHPSTPGSMLRRQVGASPPLFSYNICSHPGRSRGHDCPAPDPAVRNPAHSGGMRRWNSVPPRRGRRRDPGRTGPPRERSRRPPTMARLPRAPTRLESVGPGNEGGGRTYSWGPMVVSLTGSQPNTRPPGFPTAARVGTSGNRSSQSSRTRESSARSISYSSASTSSVAATWN